ncbi:hypothetical protein G9A89_022755 [Geosiphon pyriformis]|nr:hypothetical protein G9A89_022755 [Geosiphon pyriformis]
MAVIGFFSSVAPLNNGVVDGFSSSNGKMASKNLSSVIVADGMLLLNFGVVFELMVETDKLFGAVANKLLEAVVDKLPVAVVNKLEVDILAVDRLVATSLAGKYFDIGLGLDLDNNSEFGTGDRGFCIDFPIISCYKYDN